MHIILKIPLIPRAAPGLRPAALAQHELQQAPRRRELVGEGLVSEDLGVRKYTTFRSKGTIFHILLSMKLLIRNFNNESYPLCEHTSDV